MITLNDDLFQSYSSNDDTIRIDILYNNSFDFFYFETYKDDVLIIGTKKIVNNYENEYLKFSSLKADYASFEMVKNFYLEFKL